MALRAIPGESKVFTLYDLVNPGAGYITTGATITFDLLDSAGTVQATGAGSSGSTNDWSATLTIPATEGRYTLRVTIVYGGVTRYQEETVDVRAFLNQGGTTLRDLRRIVSRALGDLIVATATAATGTTTFADANNLRRSGTQYKGGQGYVAIGAAVNLGADNARYISGSDGSGTLTFSPAFNAGFGAGDVLEVHNDNGNGWPVQEKHGAINDALRLAAGMGGTRLSATLTTAFDQDSPTITVPSAFQRISVVEWQGDDDEWHRVMRAKRAGSPGWFTRGDGTVEVQGRDRYSMNGQTVRLYGFGRHDDLTDDEDATLVLPEFVKYQAGHQLIMAGDQRSQERRWMEPNFRAGAAYWRRAAVIVAPPDTAVVRHV